MVEVTCYQIFNLLIGKTIQAKETTLNGHALQNNLSNVLLGIVTNKKVKMKLESNKCYQILKPDGMTIIFKFLGNDDEDYNILRAQINEKWVNLYEILQGGYLAYHEVDSSLL